MIAAVLVVIFFFASLHADLIDPNVQAATEGDPSSTICDSVSLLTGDFVVFSEDLVIEGAEPLRIHRHYVSGDGLGYNGGWEFFPHLELKLLLKKEKPKKKKITDKDFIRIQTAEPNGTSLIFKRTEKQDLKKAWVPYAIDFEKRGKGITNTSRGAISGRTNLRNHKLYQEKENLISLHCADGTKRRYRKSKEDTFLLQQEDLPNGNKIHYRYGEDNRLASIDTVNGVSGTRYAWCRFHYEGPAHKTHDFTIETSDGRHLSYKFSRKEKHGVKYFLKEVNGPELPPEKEEYSGRHDHIERRVTARCLPDGRKVGVEYYAPYTSYQIGDQEVDIGGLNHPAGDRVKTLYQPLGKEGEMIPTHHFIYDIERERIEAYRSYYEYKRKGATDVYDVYLNKTSIHYTPDFLPFKILYHEKNTPHHQLKMQWGEYGQLKQKVILDPNDTPLLKRAFVYDDRGNVLEEKLTGKICHPDSQDTYSIYHEYDEKNRLTKTITPAGLITSISYLPHLALVQKKIITDGHSIHRREFYEYNSHHILITKIIDDGTAEDAANLEGVTSRKITRITPKKENPASDLPEVIEEKAVDLSTGKETLLLKTHLEYTKQAKVSKKHIFAGDTTYQYTLSYLYDDRGRIIQEIDAQGRITSYEYDIHGNITLQTEPSQKQIKQTYDCGNRLIQEEEIAPTGEKRLTQHSYDYKNNKICTRNPFGNETWYEYDPFGHVTKVIHPDQTEETYTYDILGNTTSHTDPSGHTTHKNYNAIGKPFFILYPDGADEIFTYYPNGNLHTHTHPDGLTLVYFYDPLDRVVALYYLDSSGDKVAEELFTYDSFHLLAHQDKEGISTLYTYDEAGRKKTEQRGERYTEYVYDSLGRLSKEIQNNSLVTVYVRDLLDQILEERKEDTDATLLHKISYRYDLNGHKTAIIQAEATESFTYDCFHRLTAHETGEGEKTSFLYDETFLNPQGQKVLRKTTIDPNHHRTIETYDLLMRPTRKEIQSPHGFLLFAEDYSYDPCGNCTLQRNHVYRGYDYSITLEIKKEYDPLHRLLSLQEGEYTPEEKITRFSYTPGGKLASLIKPDQVILFYAYNALGHLSHLTSSNHTIHYTYAYNLNGELLRCNSTERTLDIHGNLLAETLSNGLKIHNEYDPLGRRTLLRLPKEPPIHYTYDPLHLIQLSAFGHTATYFYDFFGRLQTVKMFDPITYTYDNRHRRTELATAEYTQTIQYDPQGNIEEMVKDDHSYSFKYDGLNQLLKENNHSYTYDSCYNRRSKDAVAYTTNTIHALTDAGATHYTYDPNGNPLTKTTPTSQTHYRYDALDRLIEVTQGNTHLHFTYDGLHRRLTKTVTTPQGKKTLHFLYDDQTEIGAYDEQGRPLELRVLGHSERETLLIKLAATLYKPIQDLQGNIVRLTSLDNTQVFTYRYHAFGEDSLYPDINPWRYASKRLDTETGLIYFGRRYYDPDKGRWLTPDPSGFTDSVNLYTYTLNNPLLYLDAFGLASTDATAYPYCSFEESMPKFLKATQTFCGLFPNIAFPAYNRLEKPQIFNVGDNEIPGRKIMSINGMMNNFKMAEEHTLYLSKLSGGYNIQGIHSPSYGIALDLVSSKILKDYAITRSIKLVHEAWDEYFRTAPKDGTILVIAHSRGTIIGRNALMLYPEEKRQKISLLCIAPATYIDPSTCSQVKHYRSEREFLQFFDWSNERKFAHTSVTLPPHPQANKFHDHGIQSPTFKRPLETHLDNYIKNGTLE